MKNQNLKTLTKLKLEADSLLDYIKRNENNSKMRIRAEIDYSWKRKQIEDLERLIGEEK